MDTDVVVAVFVAVIATVVVLFLCCWFSCMDGFQHHCTV